MNITKLMVNALTFLGAASVLAAIWVEPFTHSFTLSGHLAATAGFALGAAFLAALAIIP